MENWYLVVALMAVTGMVGVFIGRFLKSKRMVAVGGHTGRSRIGERNRQAEIAADL